MNTDRFLTRVFDKKAKKMIYVGQEVELGIFLGINNEGVMFESDYEDYGDLKTSIIVEPFGDRFVPMMCTGLKDKNGKLIYDDDLIKFENDLYLCVFNGFAFGLSSIKEACNVLVPTTLTRNKSEIIGNKWENPELLEGENDE